VIKRTPLLRGVFIFIGQSVGIESVGGQHFGESVGKIVKKLT
jgi:hypothetical protein